MVGKKLSSRSLADAVEYFRFVRDIPFRLPMSASEPDYTCVGKHIVLKALLSSLGFEVRYASCEWLWSRFDIPQSLKENPHDDSCGHVYLEVYNKEQERWMNVDATWDKRLAPKLPISEWDGRNDTTIAVKPRKMLKETIDKLDRSNFEKAPDRQFLESFNRWLESIRT